MSEERATLLIVEDDQDVAEMLNAYFDVQGYLTFTANWGEDAVKTCLSELPDLVIIDIHLPDIDGFEVACRLRENRRTRDIPIIFLTENQNRENRFRGLELKAEDYISKPFDILELRLRIQNILRRTQRSTTTNPITGLPVSVLVD